MLAKYADQRYGVKELWYISGVLSSPPHPGSPNYITHYSRWDLWRPNRIGTGFSSNGSDFFCHLLFPPCSTFIRQTGEWTIGSLEEEVPRGRLKIPGEWKRIPLIQRKIQFGLWPHQNMFGAYPIILNVIFNLLISSCRRGRYGG